MTQSSVHSSDQLIDQLLSVATVTALDEMPRLLAESTASVAQLERPEEIIRLLEMRTDGDYFVEEVFDADDPVPTEGFLDDGVVREGDTLVLGLAVTSLVDELPGRLHTGVAAGMCMCVRQCDTSDQHDKL